MDIRQFILCIGLTGFIACQPNRQSDQNTDLNKDSLSTHAIDRQKGYFDNLDEKFKYGHIGHFTTGIFKNDTLTLIDSIFHHEIISKIEGYTFPYSDKPKNYFVSKQNDINGLTALVISLYWGVCYEGLTLLILDKEKKLLNNIPLTEWYSSCDLIFDTETKFVNDSTFVQHVITTVPGEDTDLIHEIKYEGQIKHSGQVDTLKILVNKEYEE